MFVSDKMVNEFTDMYDINKDGVITQNEIVEVDNNRNQQQETKAQEDTSKVGETKSGLNVGAIVGIVIGAIFLIGIVAVVTALLMKKKKREHKGINNNTQENLNTIQINEEQIVK